DAERDHELRADRRYGLRRHDHRKLGLRRGFLDRGGDGRRLFRPGPRVPLRAPVPPEGAAPAACGLPSAARTALDLLRRHVRLPLGAAVLLERLVLSDPADRAGVRLGSPRLPRRNASPARGSGGRHGRSGRPVRHSRGVLRAGRLCVAAFARSSPGPPLVARRRRAALSTRSELSPLPKSGRLRACAPWSPTVNPIYKWMGIVLAVG